MWVSRQSNATGSQPRHLVFLCLGVPDWCQRYFRTITLLLHSIFISMYSAHYILLMDSFGTKTFPSRPCTGITGQSHPRHLFFRLIMTELRKRKRATRRLSYTPSQEGSGWLQKWFFSQTSGSSWLSLYPGSHWKDTVEPMDRSLFDRAPLTGIPGSMQEYVSSVTTAGMSKYRELPEQVLSNQRNQSLL